MEEPKAVGQPRAGGVVGQWPRQVQAQAQASCPSTATISSSGARAATTPTTTPAAAAAATTTSPAAASRPDPSIQISPSTPPRSHSQSQSQSQPPKSDHVQRRPALAPFRRLTASATSPSSLLTKQLQFKSASAVPTLSTISRDAQAISIRPDAAVAAVAVAAAAGAADERRPSSGGRHQHSRAGSAAAHDISATDMLKQAMMHRSVGPVKFSCIRSPAPAGDNPAQPTRSRGGYSPLLAASAAERAMAVPSSPSIATAAATAPAPAPAPAPAAVLEHDAWPGLLRRRS
jgi:hypothetical protein